MATTTTNILPCRFRLHQWKSARNYRLTITRKLKVGGEQSSLHCQIPLRITMTHFYGKSAVVWLQTGRPAFNGSRDYDKVQWVYARLFSLNKKVHVRMRRAGSIWQIMNKKQIQSQWHKVKEQITAMYEDPQVGDIVARYEQNLTHHFEDMYRREPLMQLLFNDLYCDYTEHAPVITKKVWPRHIGNIPFPIIEYKQLAKLNSGRDEAVISVTGQPDVKQIDQQAINSYFGELLGDVPSASYNFTYEGQYRMDTARGGIYAAALAVEGALGEVYRKRMDYDVIRTDNE